MYPYDEYKFAHHRGRFHFRNTQLLGLLPLVIATVLMAVRGTRAGPGLWSALGSALALELALWSVKAIQDEPQGRTRWGELFVQRVNVLLPPILVVVQGGFIAVTLCLLWYSFCELGFPVWWLQHALFIAVLIVPQVRRLLHVDDAFAARPRVVVAEQFLMYVQVVLVTLLLTTSLQYLIFPKDHAYITEVPLPAIVLWVPAILICAACVALFGEFIRKRRTGPSPGSPAA